MGALNSDRARKGYCFDARHIDRSSAVRWVPRIIYRLSNHLRETWPQRQQHLSAYLLLEDLDTRCRRRFLNLYTQSQDRAILPGDIQPFRGTTHGLDSYRSVKHHCRIDRCRMVRCSYVDPYKSRHDIDFANS